MLHLHKKKFYSSQKRIFPQYMLCTAETYYLMLLYFYNSYFVENHKTGNVALNKFEYVQKYVEREYLLYNGTNKKDPYYQLNTDTKLFASKYYQNQCSFNTTSDSNIELLDEVNQIYCLFCMLVVHNKVYEIRSQRNYLKILFEGVVKELEDKVASYQKDYSFHLNFGARKLLKNLILFHAVGLGYKRRYIDHELDICKAVIETYDHEFNYRFNFLLSKLYRLKVTIKI